jgi:hypothetical protein
MGMSSMGMSSMGMNMSPGETLTPTPTPTPTPNYDDNIQGCKGGDWMGNSGFGTIDSKPTSILHWNPEVSTGWGPSSTGWTPNVRATRNVVATNTNPI